MIGFSARKSPLEKEWESLVKKEQDFLKKRQEKKDSLLNQKLAEKVPEKLQSTLDGAFFKAFTVIFEKGTSVIEKTYRRMTLRKNTKSMHLRMKPCKVVNPSKSFQKRLEM